MEMLTSFKNAERTLVWSSCGFLLMAAVSKLYTVASGFRMLELYDPILLVKNRYLLIIVATIELMCATALLRSDRGWLKGIILLWLGANFFAYRVAFVLSGAETPCPCLGSVGSRIGLSLSTSDMVTKCITFYFLAAGSYLLFQDRFARMRAAEPASSEQRMEAGVEADSQA